MNLIFDLSHAYAYAFHKLLYFFFENLRKTKNKYAFCGNN